MREKLKKHSSLLTTAAAVVALMTLLVTSVYRGGKDISAAVSVSTEITNWGLSFQEEGMPPIGNASAEYLSKYNALYYTPTQEKVIYLTFDAGYEDGHMPQILDALKKHNVKAVFFLVGNYFQTEPDLVRRMVAEGHTVGNHTYTHPDMSKIADKASFQEELEKNEAAYKEITGQDMLKLYRPPQGKFSESNLKMAQEMGYSTVFWSLAYVDWYKEQQPSREEAFGKLIPRLHDGAVVLLHSTSATNAEILDDLLTAWEEKGYVFGDLTQYVAAQNK